MTLIRTCADLPNNIQNADFGVCMLSATAAGGQTKGPEEKVTSSVVDEGECREKSKTSDMTVCTCTERKT